MDASLFLATVTLVRYRPNKHTLSLRGHVNNNFFKKSKKALEVDQVTGDQMVDQVAGAQVVVNKVAGAQMVDQVAGVQVVVDLIKSRSSGGGGSSSRRSDGGSSVELEKKMENLFLYIILLRFGRAFERK